MSSKKEGFYDKLDNPEGDNKLSKIAYSQLLEAGLGKSTAIVLSGYNPDE